MGGWACSPSSSMHKTTRTVSHLPRQSYTPTMTFSHTSHFTHTLSRSVSHISNVNLQCLPGQSHTATMAASHTLIPIMTVPHAHHDRLMYPLWQSLKITSTGSHPHRTVYRCLPHPMSSVLLWKCPPVSHAIPMGCLLNGHAPGIP